MWNNILKIFNTVAIFVLGLSSPIIVFGIQFTNTYIVHGREAAMNGWADSYPWDLYGTIGFGVSLVFIILYAWWKSKKDKIEEQKKNDAMKQAVKDGLENAFSKDGLILQNINNSIKTGIKAGITEAINEMKISGGGTAIQPKPNEPTQSTKNS